MLKSVFALKNCKGDVKKVLIIHSVTIYKHVNCFNYLFNKLNGFSVCLFNSAMSVYTAYIYKERNKDLRIKICAHKETYVKNFQRLPLLLCKDFSLICISNKDFMKYL